MKRLCRVSLNLPDFRFQFPPLPTTCAQLFKKGHFMVSVTFVLTLCSGDASVWPGGPSGVALKFAEMVNW
jgi:hypothetical protein